MNSATVQHRPRRRQRLVWLAVMLAVLFAFLHGPNGLVSIFRRELEARRLLREIARLQREIGEYRTQRDWLMNPDSAAAYAHRLLDPDSVSKD